MDYYYIQFEDYHDTADKIGPRVTLECAQWYVGTRFKQGHSTTLFWTD